MRLAEKLSKPLILFWPVNPGCACQFSDLFENQITQITQEELQLLMQKNNFNQIYKFYDDWRLLSFPEDGLKRNFSQAFYSEKGNNIDFEYHRISLSVRENILKYFNRLIPKKFITEKVTQFCSKFDDNTISVHIRSWQEAKNMSKNMSKFFDIRNVYKVMDREKQGTFFVISDSAKILEQVKNRYKERILDYPRTVSPGDRGTTEGIQDAFIELLLLAKNKKLKVSHLSTYSETAWWFGGCRACVETIPMTFKGRLSLAIEEIGARIRKIFKDNNGHIKTILRILFKTLPRYLCCLLLRTLRIRKNRLPALFIPSRLRNRYDMNGKIHLSYNYSDDSYLQPIVYTKGMLDSYIEKVMKHEVFYYQQTDTWLYQALEKHGINNKSVVIMGSRLPVYESICLAYGGRPTTVEYNTIISQDARLKIMTVEECVKRQVRFDAAFSISSFEHDGLGRYGDALNPDGDLEMMKKMQLVLKPNGLLFLAVPVGPDALVWNSHRIYGKLRLPLLLKDWEIIDTFGFSESSFEHRDPGDKDPVFVLKNLSNI